MAQKKYLDYAGLETLLEKLFGRQFKGMGLSHEDFTAELKSKYDSFVNGGASADDLAALATRVSAVEALIESDSDAAINKFNEIVEFLAGIDNTDTMAGIVSGIESKVTEAKNLAAGKADKATTLAGYGITDAKIADDGTITLGAKTVKPLTEHQSLAAYAKTSEVDAKVANLATKTELTTGLATKVNESDLVAITNAEILALVNE